MSKERERETSGSIKHACMHWAKSMPDSRMEKVRRRVCGLSCVVRTSKLSTSNDTSPKGARETGGGKSKSWRDLDELNTLKSARLVLSRGVPALGLLRYYD